MKILHIITSLKIGGAEQALCNLLSAIKEKQFEHHVAYLYDGPCVQIIKALGIKTYQIKGLFFRYDPWAYLQLKKLIKKIKPDILHTALWSANILGRLLSLHTKIPVIGDLHGNCIDEGTFRNFLDRLTAHIPAVTIAVADSVKLAYDKTILAKTNKKPKKIIVIKNSIDSQKIRAQALEKPITRASLGLKQEAFIIGAVGRLEPIKSYDILIKAFFLLSQKYLASRPLQLCLIGNGSQLKPLKALTQALSIQEQVLFMGARQDVYNFYPLFDCFALSSRSEGLSIALLEALCFSLPIVTTNSGSTHEVITHGLHGFLVPPENPEALAQALEKLYLDKDLVKKIALENAVLIKQVGNIKNVAQEYSHIYEQTIKQK